MASVMLLAFALTLFLSASLLFLVQPMVGKLLLPYLGGTPAVWNTCMVFFQALLLAGYGYAHLLTRIKNARKQLLIHALVLLLPLVPLFLLWFDPAILAAAWPPPSEANPIPWLLVVLLITAGLPFFVVSATAPLLQKWFAGTDHPDAKDPYFLYAASNVGSMGALLLYPALVEWAATLSQQRTGWAFSYIALAALIAWAGWLAVSRQKEPAPEGTPTPETPEKEEGRIPTWFDRVRWVLLAFVPSSVMIGCTTHLTTDIAPVPLLWTLPLAIYLASFIFVFSRLPLWLTLGLAVLIPVGVIGALALPSGFKAHAGLIANDDLFQGWWAEMYQYLRVWLTQPLQNISLVHLLVLGGVAVLVGTCCRTPQGIHALAVVLAPVAGLAIAFENELRTFLLLYGYELIILHLGVLFIVSLVCHGELARTRPRTRYLTEFYLLMSLGGVLGGAFNSLLAPVVYDRVWEYPLAVAFMLLLMPWPSADKEAGWAAADSWIVASFGLLIGLFLTGLFVAKMTYQRHASVEWVKAKLPPGWQPLATFLARQMPDEVGPGPDPDTAEVADWDVLYRERNFFGSFRVLKKTCLDEKGTERVFHLMFHGTTTHGVELRSITKAQHDDTPEPNAIGDPLAYFHKAGPMGDIFRDRDRLKGPLKIGVIGVGTGTLAAYAKKDWEMVLFDIDPAVVRVASDPQYFNYIPDAKARGVSITTVLGDGRQEMLKRPAEEKYDIIFMDAFASDAVPIHLLTKEATQVYLDRLAPGGMIVFNIANRYLDFEPLLGNLCKELGLVGYVGHGRETPLLRMAGNSWVAIARSRDDLGTLPTMKGTDLDKEATRWRVLKRKEGLKVWTDDYANLLSVFLWGGGLP